MKFSRLACCFFVVLSLALAKAQNETKVNLVEEAATPAQLAENEQVVSTQTIKNTTEADITSTKTTADDDLPMLRSLPDETEKSKPVQPVLRVSQLKSDKVVGFITRSGSIFEIQDENGAGMIEGRQATTNNTNETFICNMGTVMIYSDEPCDGMIVEDITQAEQDTQTKPPQTTEQAAQTQRQHAVNNNQDNGDNVIDVDNDDDYEYEYADDDDDYNDDEYEVYNTRQKMSSRAQAKRRRQHAQNLQQNRRRKSQKSQLTKRNGHRHSNDIDHVIRRPANNRIRMPTHRRRAQQSNRRKALQSNDRRRQQQILTRRDKQQEDEQWNDNKRRRIPNRLQQKRRKQNLSANPDGQLVRIKVRRIRKTPKNPRWEMADKFGDDDNDYENLQ